MEKPNGIVHCITVNEKEPERVENETFEDGTISLNASVNRPSRKKEELNNERRQNRKKTWGGDHQPLVKCPSKLFWDPAIQETVSISQNKPIKSYSDWCSAFCSLLFSACYHSSVKWVFCSI